MKTVFVDTSGFYACLDGTDPFHPPAKEAFARALQENWNLITTSFVIHESWALIQRRLGWDALDSFINDLLPLCSIEWVDESVYQDGVNRCSHQRERRFSLTDAISINVMHAKGITEAIAMEEHFVREKVSMP